MGNAAVSEVEWTYEHSQAEFREYELTELKQEFAQLQQQIINNEESVAEQAVHSALVRNFNLGLVNDLNLSNAESITCDEFEQEKLNQTHPLNDLKLQSSKSMPRWSGNSVQK